MKGRTIWRAKPCGWRDRERVVALGQEFGANGTQVLDLLEELAKEQTRDQGVVRTGLRSIARGAFLDRGPAGLSAAESVELARKILTFAVEVGALDELDISDDRDMKVTCRVSGFARDQGRGYEAVGRSQRRAAERERLRDETSGPDGRQSPDDPGHCPEKADSVRKCPPTEQDSREEQPSRARAREGQADEQIKVSFRGQRIPATQVDLAVKLLGEFNRVAGTGYQPVDGEGNGSSHLKRIIGALRTHPETDEAAWVRAIEWRIPRPFGSNGWNGKPGVGVVFGPEVVDQNLESSAGTSTVSDDERRRKILGAAAR